MGTPDIIASLRETLKRRKRQTITRDERAAVLVPIIDDGGPLRLLLTRRTEDLPTHQGQVAFPGGHVDPDDADPAATALREAEEEVGLSPAHVEVIGLLDDQVTQEGTVAVTPVVGLVARLPELHPTPAEVAHVFTIPVTDLTRAERWKSEDRIDRDREIRLHFFRHEGETLWGLSARIVVHLLELTPLGSPVE